MAFNLSKFLKGANKDWKTAKKRAKERKPQFLEYNDGRYLARLVGADIGESNGGRVQIDFSWKFEDGEYEKKVKHDYQGIETEDNLYWLAQRIEQLGYEMIDDLSELPELLKEILKARPLCTIQLKTNGEFQNVYIKKVHDDEEDAEGDEDEDDAESDDTEDSDEDSDEESDEEEGDEESDDTDEDSDDDTESDEEESDDEEEGNEEESDDEEEDDDAVDLEVGMSVIAETAKGREPGKVIEIVEKEGKVRVKLKNGKVVRVGIDKLEMDDDGDDDTPEEPKGKKSSKKEDKKPSKKPAPPAKKPAAKSGKKVRR